MNRILLGDVATSQTGPFGSQLHEEDYVMEGTPIVTVEHLGDVGFTLQNLPFVSDEDAERLKKYTLQEGDIVFSRVGAIDRSVYVKKEQEGWLFSGRCLRVRCDKSKINSRYLSYYFKQKEFKNMMLNVSVGATMPSLNTDIMNNIEIYAVDRETQDKIADLLDAIDTKIEKNIFTITEIEMMVKTIYSYWFLQYDFPDENGKPYKSSGGKMIWNEELKREIPVGWRVGTIETIGDVVGGGTPPTKHTEYYCKEGIGWITPYDLANTTDKYIAHGQRDITEEGIKKSSAKLLPRGTVLMTSRAPIGYLAIASEVVCTNQGFKSIVPKSGFGSEFVYYTILNVIPYIKSLGTGSTFTEVSKEVVSEVKIVVPPKEIHQSFENSILKFSMQIKVLEGERRELSSLRDFLLPLLMNGQIGFRERQ